MLIAIEVRHAYAPVALEDLYAVAAEALGDPLAVEKLAVLGARRVRPFGLRGGFRAGCEAEQQRDRDQRRADDSAGAARM